MVPLLTDPFGSRRVVVCLQVPELFIQTINTYICFEISNFGYIRRSTESHARGFCAKFFPERRILHQRRPRADPRAPLDLERAKTSPPKMWCTAADKTALLAEGITQAASASPALIRPLTNALFHISLSTTACGALGAARRPTPRVRLACPARRLRRLGGVVRRGERRAGGVIRFATLRVFAGRRPFPPLQSAGAFPVSRR